MVGCSILQCKSRSEQGLAGISFHSFPKDPELKQKWIHATGRVNWEPKKFSKICSMHFEPGAIIFKNKQKRLLPNVFPTTQIASLPFNEEDINVSGPSTNYPTQNSSSSSQKIVQDNPLRVPAKRLCTDPSSSAETPRKKKLIRRNNKLQQLSSERLKKIKALRQSKRRLAKKHAFLQNILTELKCKMHLSSEELDLLGNIETVNLDFLKRVVDKKNCPRKFSESVRKFALSLHFISPKAYNFLRKEFNTCLPHPRTLSRWYSCIDGEPGFTQEAFDAIKVVANNSKKQLLLCVCVDEMSIRQHLQWNGKKSVGYVNIGDNLENENLPLAKDALVFMVTSLNSNFKLPVGYFLTNGVTGEQRSGLLQNCVRLLGDCGVDVVSVTFDGCPSNFAMAKHLGANFDSINNINPTITLSEQCIVIYPDPCHMIKLIRNTFGDKRNILNASDEFISWEYIEKLHNIQDGEGCHLANKLRKTHVQYKKQIMKVRLAVQTLSKSVAQSLSFCKNELKLDDFRDAGATIEFILFFNNIFDIMNSRNLCSYGYKKPLSRENFSDFNSLFHAFQKYVGGLKFIDGQEVLKSGRKTGFLGLLICIEALRKIYYQYIDVDKQVSLKFLCTYKMSQDHLEVFFSAIRSKGGFNNNPTAIQFMSAYKRLVVHGEIKYVATTGNCVPLGNINILTCNQSSLLRKLNNTRNRLESMDDELLRDENWEAELTEVPEGHDYISSNSLSQFSKEIVMYVAGYVVTKIYKIIKCDECLTALVTLDRHSGLIAHKDAGGLHYPSKDVAKVCLYAEKILKHFLSKYGHASFSNKKTLPKLVCQILKNFLGSDIFSSLNDHIKDQNPLNNHLILLIKAISFRYLEIKIHYILKSVSQKDERIRNFHTKLVLFKGQ